VKIPNLLLLATEVSPIKPQKGHFVPSGDLVRQMGNLKKLSETDLSVF